MGYIKDFNLSIYHSKYTQVHPVWLWMAKYHLTAQDGFPQKTGTRATFMLSQQLPKEHL